MEGSLHLSDALAAAAGQTWFSYDGCLCPEVPTKGVPPGDPLGDLCYLHGVRSVLIKCRADMAEQQLGLPVEGLERPLRDLPYVDDATFLHACRAASALGDLAMLTRIVHHRFCQAHLR
eukprot:15474850-Alexandrium_andersonii.AAC.1